MVYVDGFLIKIKKSKLKAYQKMASLGGKVWMKHGALNYKECVIDDIPKGPMTGALFTKRVNAKKTDTVIFSYIEYKSKAHRNAVNKKVMKDPLMNNFDPKDMPFTMKDMSFAGFKVLVDHNKK